MNGWIRMTEICRGLGLLVMREATVVLKEINELLLGVFWNLIRSVLWLSRAVLIYLSYGLMPLALPWPCNYGVLFC